MSGQLFTQYYLTEGIRSTTRWHSSAANAEAFRDGVQRSYDALKQSHDPNEAVTEQELIRPVLELLGWADYLPQQGAARNEDIPDLLLFAGADSKARAAARSKPDQRYGDALVVEESKRFGLPLDARDEDDVVRARTPHGQILRYLSTADAVSEDRIRWGILTNGGVHGVSTTSAPVPAPPATSRSISRISSSPTPKTVCAPSICCSAATPSSGGRARRTLFWSARWRRAGATSSRSRKTFRGSCSSAPFPASRRPWQTPAAGTSHKSARRRWCSSTGCCSCSTRRTGDCCPSTTPATTTTGCERRCATTSPAA